MKKKLILTTLLTMPFLFVACDNQGSRQEEQSQPEGEVIQSNSRVLEQQPADIQEQEVKKGSEDVQYKTKRQVTQTVRNQQEIPTVQVCQSKANINEMDQQDFVALGFDQQSAQRIVQTREQRGRFNSVDELSQINGVSPDGLSQVRDSLGVAPRQAQEE